jgi:hypothetical protein
MPVPFSNIGFSFSDDKSLNRLLETAIKSGTTIKSRGGFCHRYEVGDGPELWLSFNEKKEIVDYNPHYSGKSRIYFGVDKMIPGHPQLMAGCFLGWVYRPDEVSGELQQFSPLMISDRIFDLDPPAKSGDRYLLQVAAFAQGLKCYPDSGEFCEYENGKHQPPGLFVPAGLMPPKGEKVNYEKGSPNAYFSGKVLECEVKHNPEGDDYLWVLVQTFAGTFDVVADLETIEGECKVGGAVKLKDQAWLSGLAVKE